MSRPDRVVMPRIRMWCGLLITYPYLRLTPDSFSWHSTTPCKGRVLVPFISDQQLASIPLPTTPLWLLVSIMTRPLFEKQLWTACELYCVCRMARPRDLQYPVLSTPRPQPPVLPPVLRGFSRDHGAQYVLTIMSIPTYLSTYLLCTVGMCCPWPEPALRSAASTCRNYIGDFTRPWSYSILSSMRSCSDLVRYCVMSYMDVEVSLQSHAHQYVLCHG
jgi:hypothetical protein